MGQKKFPVTPAIRVLRSAAIEYEPHLYEYEEKGGTAASAKALEVDEHSVVKTLVMEDETKTPFLVLMHGDCEVSTKALARHLGVKTIQPCAPQVADRHSGYKVGGTSPFGTKRTMKVYVQRTILDLGRIYVNGGKRGFLVGIDPGDAARVLDAELVECRA